MENKASEATTKSTNTMSLKILYTSGNHDDTPADAECGVDVLKYCILKTHN